LPERYINEIFLVRGLSIPTLQVVQTLSGEMIPFFYIQLYLYRFLHILRLPSKKEKKKEKNQKKIYKTLY